MEGHPDRSVAILLKEIDDNRVNLGACLAIGGGVLLYENSGSRPFRVESHGAIRACYRGNTGEYRD